jgi:hypothetical protein
MLLKQKEKAQFTGGFEAARLTDLHVYYLSRIKPKSVWFAYDSAKDYEPLVFASKKLKEAGLMKGHTMCCYVLTGHEGDTIDKAEKRLKDVIKLGYFPQSMLYNAGSHRNGDLAEWRKFHTEWANKIIVGFKMKQYTQKTMPENGQTSTFQH